ncbi:WGR domain protein [Leptospira santarosai str. CBC1416]|uniref:WGR domain protein n=1 Tax=Leptospira santarosai str. CBC1416 TaxID=1193059 RepID=M6VP69_9LEPT|nr:WGR domain protein [Leptospira santarosai str. CBC1416]
MKYHLTFKDDKSDKFWNIEVDETSFTVTYGKTGTKNNSTRSLSPMYLVSSPSAILLHKTILS